MDKIDVMDVDYEAAMVRRKAVHDDIINKLESERAAKAAKVPVHLSIAADTRPVLMAVAGKNGVVAEHFGHAREFLIYEASPEGVRFISHRKTELYCAGLDTCGDGGVAAEDEPESVLERNIRTLSGCEVVLCSKIGFEPWGMLEAAGIQPNGEHAMEPIEDAVMAVYKEMYDAGKLAAPGQARQVA